MSPGRRKLVSIARPGVDRAAAGMGRGKKAPCRAVPDSRGPDLRLRRLAIVFWRHGQGGRWYVERIGQAHNFAQINEMGGCPYFFLCPCFFLRFTCE